MPRKEHDMNIMCLQMEGLSPGLSSFMKSWIGFTLRREADEGLNELGGPHVDESQELHMSIKDCVAQDPNVLKLLGIGIC